jgi:hypothetical protein
MINRDHHRGVKLAGNGKGAMKGRFATKGSEFLGRGPRLHLVGLERNITRHLSTASTSYYQVICKN